MNFVNQSNNKTFSRFVGLSSPPLFTSQVGLWKSHSKHKPREGRFVSPRTLASLNNMANSPNSNLKSLQNLIQEIEYLHSSREWQVEETASRNQRLEQDLWRCKEAVAALEDSNRLLKTEQASMRRKVEEARQALLSGLEKVKDLEAKASRVPALQRHVVQMESELLYYRYRRFTLRNVKLFIRATPHVF